MNQTLARTARALLSTVLCGAFLGFFLGAALGLPSDPFWLWGGFVLGLIGAVAFGAGFLTALTARIIVWRGRAAGQRQGTVLSVLASGLGSAVMAAPLLLQMQALLVLPFTAVYGLAAAATAWVLAQRKRPTPDTAVTAAAESVL